MRLIPRLLMGGHRELRRPVHVVDEGLMKRIEDARQRLRREGKDVKPLRGFNRREQHTMPRSQAS